MGIFGANDIAFVKDYVNEAIKFLSSERNATGWGTITDKKSYCVVFEQFVFACMAKAYGKDVVSLDREGNDERLTALGYTHLWGAKRDWGMETRLAGAVERHCPQYLPKIDGLFSC